LLNNELHFFFVYIHTTITIERTWNHLLFVDYQREQLKMLEGKGVVQETDMPLKMQIQAMSFASQALDLYDICDGRSIAGFIKKVHYSNTLKILFYTLKFELFSTNLINPNSSLIFSRNKTLLSELVEISTNSNITKLKHTRVSINSKFEFIETYF
jgi:hypothetical protein